VKLTAENVNAIFLDCLFKENEETSNCIKVEGIVTDWITPDYG
jgi:hypothetical protein